MEFWGCEVKPGMNACCEPGAGFVIHLSQAALGETKKGSDNVLLFVKVGDQKLVIGTLSADKHPQISCDLIFDDTFELSHNSKTTSVFLCGYKSVMPDMFESDSGEDEEEELEANENHVKKIEAEKPAAKVSAKEEKKDKQNESDSDDSSDSDDLSSDGDSMSEDMSSGSDDSEDEDESEDDSEDESEDEETPVPEVGKKRTAATPVKTPSDKKAKISTPEKETGNKKGVHVATPHPAKHASKTPADGKQKEKGPKTPADSKVKAPKTPADSKAKDKSPKSGSHTCKSCSKTFTSAVGLESHQKAKKHEA